MIDECGPNAIARLTRSFASSLSVLQTGFVYHYAFAMMAGVVAIVTWLAFRSGLIGG